MIGGGWQTVVLLCLCLYAGNSIAQHAGGGFIRADGGRFVDEDCNEFIPSGLNTWQLLEVAAGKVKSKPVMLENGMADVVQWTMATAAANKLNVVRSFAHGVDGSFPLQIKAGKYSEHAFQALDYILDEASKYGVRLLLTLVNNWDNADSKTQYIQWAGAEGHDVFFTDPEVKQLYKDHIDTMVNRRNTINNRLYRDDPTIFAWDLMNEPRCDCFPDFIPVPDSYVSCRPECAEKVQSWIDEMSKYLKKADPNHMITVGEEGFYTKGSTGELVNPGTGWASLTGQDFIANHASPAIDFAAAHIWPDNWETWDVDFLEAWIKQHAADAKAMGKPFMIEEFGKEVHLESGAQANITSIRGPFYRKVYQQLQESLAADGPLKGVIFWQWGFAPYVAEEFLQGCIHCQAIQVSSSDGVFKNIIAPVAEHAAQVALNRSPVAGCKPVPTAKRAQTLVMPGTLPLHQTSDELLASSSDSLSADNAVFGSSTGSSSQQHQQHDGISFDNTISADKTGSNTVRMGKMLQTQSRAKPTAHHHAATGR
uniref:mannan endo-1,4-beta-mannosidase n=1 Tax=Trebouxia lynnae TaxID=1825957 RepID=A0A7L9QEC4_9CHLO|nr:putative extracellular protein TR9_011a [Trebouxia lynnae]